METNTIYQGDCLEVMANFPDNSIDTIITDPPYGLKFMSKNWDHGIPGMRFWEEMLRVAKPGATLMAFGGTRTHHRLMVAIEDAGWEVRDCISHFHSSDDREMALLDSMNEDQVQAYLELHYPNEVLSWIYGSGFPKSHDISKSLDRMAGKKREVVGERIADDIRGGNFHACNRGKRHVINITASSTDLAKQFNGYGTALKPAFEPIIVAMKPIEKNYAYNAEKWGVAGLNIDGGRVGIGGNGKDNWRHNCYEKDYEYDNNERAFSSLNGKLSRRHPKGRWPANVLLSHSAGCTLRGVKRVSSPNGSGIVGDTTNSPKTRDIYGNYGELQQKGFTHLDIDGKEEVEDWECEPDCAIRLLDEQGLVVGVHSAGSTRPPGGAGITSSTFKNIGDGKYGGARYGDKGGASRFFKNFPSARFVYSGKASRKERGKGNNHPTVKPLKIVEYLALLTKTLTGGIILDPFAGSGTTALAALATDRPYILIEKEAEYAEIAKQRIAGYTGETIYISEEQEEVGQLMLW